MYFPKRSSLALRNKPIKYGKTDSWSGMLSEKDLDQKGETWKLIQQNLTKMDWESEKEEIIPVNVNYRKNYQLQTLTESSSTGKSDQLYVRTGKDIHWIFYKKLTPPANQLTRNSPLWIHALLMDFHAKPPLWTSSSSIKNHYFYLLDWPMVLS